MNRALFLVVVTGIILLVGHFLRAPAIQAGAQGGGAAAKTNGDCNGDGALNLTDAVYLLQHLFQGGPAPVPIQGAQPAPCALLATGQTKCFDDAGSEVPCDSPEFPGQDGFYQAGVPLEDCYVDNGDGTVTDICTGLMWQRDTAPGDYSWKEALRYCDDLELAGYDDWRLPNARELQSIVHLGRVAPALDPVFAGLPFWYWSSSSSARFPDMAWVVTFYDGDLTWIEWTEPPTGEKHERYLVRAVRGGL
jgi:hypothetical protein